jgi:uncharacterized protein
MAKIAIIGTGISGLSAAHLLHPHHDITVYEKASRIGGHTRTLTVRYGDRDIPVDTGFIVFNERNYPQLTALFRALGVATQKSNMSFALTAGNGAFEWGAENLNAVFGQRRNLLDPRFHKLFRDVLHFNSKALKTVEANPDIGLGSLIEHMRLGDWFRRYYLLPMGGAIWSCPPQQMLSFPAAAFVRFFANHGLLSANGQPQWHTVTGGSQTYVDRLVAGFRSRIRTNCAATNVRRTEGGVVVRDRSGGIEHFDQVVLASHADETLTILGDATAVEHAALRAIPYQRNRAFLHKDPQFMPKRRRCWASWVYHSDGKGDEQAVAVSYWMNRLQSIDARYPLFVTLNPRHHIPDEHIFDEHEFMHPVFGRDAITAQAQIKKLQGSQNTWFCGAWLGHGFHEDGLASGINVAKAINAMGRDAAGEIAGRRTARTVGSPEAVAAA